MHIVEGPQCSTFLRWHGKALRAKATIKCQSLHFTALMPSNPLASHMKTSSANKCFESASHEGNLNFGSHKCAPVRTVLGERLVRVDASKHDRADNLNTDSMPASKYRSAFPSSSQVRIPRYLKSNSTAGALEAWSWIWFKSSRHR